MNLYQYSFTGDPAQLLAAWEQATAGFAASDLFLHVVAAGPTGITVLDVCPSEADFQGWIHGDAWRRIKAEIGGDVVVTPLGEIRSAVARDSVVDVVRAPAATH